MPICPAPTCRQLFRHDMALSVHISRMPNCRAWVITSTNDDIIFLDDQIPNDGISLYHNSITDLNQTVYNNELFNDDRDNITSPTSSPIVDPTSFQHYYTWPFPNAARRFNRGITPYHAVRNNEIDPTNIAYPFAGLDEWGLAYWLSRSGLPQTQIDAFLELRWISNLNEYSPSFKSSKDLSHRIESLPSGPRWKSQYITLPEAPNDPQLLLYRDPVECLEWLEANPEFTTEKDYMPYYEYLDQERTERCYNELASCNAWHAIQKEFPDDITVLPYILASDSTHLTNFSGDKKIKPLLIANGHIHTNVRAAPSRKAFMCTAFFPEPKFIQIQYSSLGQYQRYPGYLRNRFFHEGMKIVTATLKLYTHVPKEMVDSEGFIRKEILRLVIYTADLPEQGLIAGLVANHCVICQAGTHDLGSSSACALRTGASILNRIQDVRSSLPIANQTNQMTIQEDTWMFAEASRKIGLNGVESPFWADFRGLDICQVIPPDILHGLHKAFKDHHVTWLTNLIGKNDMDMGFMLQPKMKGFRHFGMGLSRLSQFSGKEHRDMQRYIFPAVADHKNLPLDAIKATRAELDFIYTAQYLSHTDHTLADLEGYNQRFHQCKDIFIRTGARRGKNGTIGHFNIPKIHTRHHYIEFIRRVGSTAGTSTEAPERYHQEVAKLPYSMVSAHGYETQMARFLDRQEKVLFFDRYLSWRVHHSPNVEEESMTELPYFPETVDLPTVVYEPLLSIKPHLAKQNLEKMLQLFNITSSAFIEAVKRYEAGKEVTSHGCQRYWVYSLDDDTIPNAYNELDIWTLFRLQLPLLDQLHDHTEVRLIRAQPKTADKQEAFDVVFVDMDHNSMETQIGIRGYEVVRLRMIFKPMSNPGPSDDSLIRPHLAFVECFTRFSIDPETKMYPVRKKYFADGCRHCEIVELEQVVQPCPLSPRFNGTPAYLKTAEVTGTNCLDVIEDFWINCFHSKSTYQTVF